MKIIIYGTGSLSRYVYYLISNDTDHSVAGFCVEEAFKRSDNFLGLPLVSLKQIKKVFPPSQYLLFVAVGANNTRKRIFDETKESGYSFFSYISSKSITWDDLTIGENTWIGEGSIFQPYVEIGDNTIIFGSSVGHHTKICAHTLISGSTIGGSVVIGESGFLGMNSTIGHNVSIAANNIIGMGTIINNIGMGTIINNNTSPSDVYHVKKGITVKSNVPAHRLRNFV